MLIPVFSGETGYASWYGGKFQGRLTANGEIFDTFKKTAAHKTLPFGTFVRVTNLTNNRSVVVRINDRGPFVKGRIIDLSRAAADSIGMIGKGITKVRIEVVHKNNFVKNPSTLPPKATTPLPGVPVPVQHRKILKIQLGSFQKKSNAKRMFRLLIKKGFRPVLQRAGGMIRVLLINIPAFREDNIRKKLGSMGIKDILVSEMSLR